MRVQRWPLVALASLLLLSAARDALMLLRYPVAVGADGYYYVLQVNELLNHGRLYFPSNTPLIFYALAGLSSVMPNSIIAIKLGSVMLHLLLCLGVYALESAITRNRWLGVLAGAIVALSGMHFYMIAEFIKNLGGVALLIWAGWSAIRALGTHNRRWIIFSVVLLIGALLSHVSTWGIAFAIVVLILLLRSVANLPFSRSLKLGWPLAILFLMVVPSLLAAQGLVVLPPWLESELLVRPEWPISLRSPVGRAEMVTLLLTVPMTLFFTVRRWRTLPGITFKLVVCTVALLSLLITLNPFLNHDVRHFGIVGRLDHLMYLQVAVILPAFIWLTLNFYRRVAGLVLVLTFCFLAASMMAPLPRGLQTRYLTERELMIRALPEQRQRLGTNPLVIAQHGDEFVVSWVLGLPAQQKLAATAQGESIYWLLHQVNPAILTPSMVVVMEEENGSGLILMNHSELRQWIGTIDEADRNRLLAQNPHLKRYVDNQSILKFS